MLEYIQRKEYSGFNPRIPAHVKLLLDRYTVDHSFFCVAKDKTERD
jgi:hypothetical protein